LLVWVIGSLGFEFNALAGTMVMVGPARKAGRGSCLIPDHLDLAAIDRLANFVPAESD
jgi:hypothetical protein